MIEADQMFGQKGHEACEPITDLELDERCSGSCGRGWLRISALYADDLHAGAREADHDHSRRLSRSAGVDGSARGFLKDLTGWNQ